MRRKRIAINGGGKTGIVIASVSLSASLATPLLLTNLLQILVLLYANLGAIFFSQSPKRTFKEIAVIIAIITLSVYAYLIGSRFLVLTLGPHGDDNNIKFLIAIIGFTAGNLMKEHIERLLRLLLSSPRLAAVLKNGRRHLRKTIEDGRTAYVLRLSVANRGNAAANAVRVVLLEFVDRTTGANLLPEASDLNPVEADDDAGGTINLYRNDEAYFNVLQERAASGGTESDDCAVCTRKRPETKSRLTGIVPGDYLLAAEVRCENAAPLRLVWPLRIRPAAPFSAGSVKTPFHVGELQTRYAE